MSEPTTGAVEGRKPWQIPLPIRDLSPQSRFELFFSAPEDDDRCQNQRGTPGDVRTRERPEKYASIS